MRLSECPVRPTIDVIEGKWKPIIVNALKQGTLRFGQLRRQVPEASRKVLTEQLRELEDDGIIRRRTSEKRWERVEYSLSSYGRTLVPVLTLMAKWGKTHKKSKARCLRAVTEGTNSANDRRWPQEQGPNRDAA
jgi:DNA-binding HxlR family transcriptional regulator